MSQQRIAKRFALRRRISTLLAAALVLGVGVSGVQVAVAPAPASAASSTAADIRVQVAGKRTGPASSVANASNTRGNNTVDGLAGVTLRLFASAANALSGTNPLSGTWASAVSDANGVATFTNVPVSQGSVWFRATSAPAGWVINTQLATSPIGNPDTQTTTRDYVFRVPVSGNLAANTTYYSAGMAQPSGTRAEIMTAPSGTDEAGYKGSTGRYTLLRANPTMPQTCSGLNIALILDKSNSVTEASGARKNVMDAAWSTINAFTNTSMAMQVFSFGTQAQQLSNLLTLTPNNATALKNAIGNPDTRADRDAFFAGTQWTNWDAALWKARSAGSSIVNTIDPSRSGRFDLVIVFTDGNPTIFTDTPGVSGSTLNYPSNSGNTRFAETETAAQTANALKESGTHIKVVGVGNGLTTAAHKNLAAISGPTQNTDFFVGGWTDAASKIQEAVLKDCTPSLTITKHVQNFNETTWNVASGWNMRVTDFTTFSANDVDYQGKPWQKTTDGSGSVFYQFKTESITSKGSVTAQELIADPTMWKIDKTQTGGQNAKCAVINASSTGSGTALGNAVSTTAPYVVSDGDLGFKVLNVGARDMIKCDIYNKQIDPLNASATLAGSFDGGYDWSLSKTNDVGSGVVRVRAGATQDVEYTLTAQAARVADSGFTATGMVTLTNDQSIARTYNTANITVNGATVTTEPSGTVTVPAKSGSTNGSVTVKVTATFGGITAAPAAARVTVAGLGGGRADVTSAVAAFTVNTPLANATAVLSDEFPEFAAQLGAVEVNAADALAGKDFTYTVTYSADNDALVGSDVADRVIGNCQASKDAVGGIEGTRFVNKATLAWDADVAKARSTVELCAGQDLTVAKSVDATLVRKLDWDISKKVLNPSAPTATTEWQDVASKKVENVDGSAQFTYQVTATPLPMTDATWAITGTITMSNPNPWPVTAQVKDFPSFKDAAECTVVTDADSAAGFVVPASGSRDVTYECDFVEGAARPSDAATNTAGIKWDAAEAFSAGSRAKSDAMPVTFVTDPANLLDEYTVTVTDSNVDNHTLCGEDTCTATWNADLTPTVFEYTVNVHPTSDIAPITCNSSTATDWTVNTATLSTGAEDTADVCVWDSRPEATLLFTGSYDVNYGWNIVKSVDKTTVQQATPGSDVDFTYTLDVTASKTFSGAKASGTITVTNTSATPLAWSEITPTVVANTTGGTVTFTKPADEEFLAAGAEGVIQVRWVAAKATGQPTGMFRVDVTAFGQSILNVPHALATVFAFTNADVTEHGRFADITDTFTEFADVTGVDAEDVLALGGTQQFTYTASRGADTLVADKTIQVMGDTPEDLTYTAPETIAQCQYTTDKDGNATLVDEGTTFTNTATITWTNGGEEVIADDEVIVTVCNDPQPPPPTGDGEIMCQGTDGGMYLLGDPACTPNQPTPPPTPPTPPPSQPEYCYDDEGNQYTRPHNACTRLTPPPLADDEFGDTGLLPEPPNDGPEEPLPHNPGISGTQPMPDAGLTQPDTNLGAAQTVSRALTMPRLALRPVTRSARLALTGAGLMTLVLGLIAATGGIAALKPKRREQ
jgi:hypothetical protein